MRHLLKAGKRNGGESDKPHLSVPRSGNRNKERPVILPNRSHGYVREDILTSLTPKSLCLRSAPLGLPVASLEGEFVS